MPKSGVILPKDAVVPLVLVALLAVAVIVYMQLGAGNGDSWLTYAGTFEMNVPPQVFPEDPLDPVASIRVQKDQISLIYYLILNGLYEKTGDYAYPPDDFLPVVGSTVRVQGHLTEHYDINAERFYKLEVVGMMGPPLP